MDTLNEMINDIYERVRLDEGIAKLRSFFIYLYRCGPIPVKALSLYLRLPVPVVAAIKNECKRNGLVMTASGGVMLTDAGVRYVQEALCYRGVDKDKLNRVLELLESSAPSLSSAPPLPSAPPVPSDLLTALFEQETKRLAEIYAGRPTVDTTVDQSLCTAETGIHRALLMLRTGGLFGQRLFFAGDDDMTSIAVWLVLNALCQTRDTNAVSMTVMDVDERILRYITQTASDLGVPVDCVPYDFRQPLPETHKARYDAVFTDPPYTVPGLSLFVSRGIQALKPEPDLYLYLSHARKEPASQLETQRMLTDAGLVITQINARFNRYHGAQILGGVSDLTVLTTTHKTRLAAEKPYDKPNITEDAGIAESAYTAEGVYTAAMYTHEINPRVRLYVCKNCQTPYRVGQKETVPTIERLKDAGCTVCGGNRFALRERMAANEEHGV